MKKIILGTTLLVLLSSSPLFAGADAGIEQEVHSGDKVVLDGSESSLDNDGRFVRTKWKQADRKERVDFSSSKRRLVTSFTAPVVDEATTFRFRLITKERFKCHKRRGCISKSRDFVNVIVYPKEVTSEVEPPVSNGETITHKGFVYDSVTSPITGRVWLDRNLGAKKVCTNVNDVSCFGDLYQWGRDADGHQLKSSPKSLSVSKTIEVGNDMFFRDTGSGDYTTIDDWTSADNSGEVRSINWSKTDGSSICPVDYRVPSSEELLSEFSVIDNGFNSFLRIPNAGERGFFGDYVGAKKRFNLWSSTPINNGFGLSVTLPFSNKFNKALRVSRNEGHSIRCIQD